MVVGGSFFSSRGAPADALDVTCFGSGSLVVPTPLTFLNFLWCGAGWGGWACFGLVRIGAIGLGTVRTMRLYQLKICPAAASPRVLTRPAVTHHLGARRPSDSVHAQGHRPLP